VLAARDCQAGRRFSCCPHQPSLPPASDDDAEEDPDDEEDDDELMEDAGDDAADIELTMRRV
jgi:hypothetical protein